MRHLRLVVAAAVAIAAGAAQAKSGYLTTFNSRYGTARTALDDCNLCHSAEPYNAYGIAVRDAGSATSITSALAAVEQLDSDRDGYKNLDEINARTLPGDAASFPAPTVTYCADGDRDGYVVCSSACTTPAGAACGECNDGNAAVNPGAAEVCTDSIDNDCDGLADARDPACAPADSDYDIATLVAPTTAILRKATTVSVTVANAGASTGGATLTLTGRLGRKTITLASCYVLSASGQVDFPWKPSATGTVVWTATIIDGTNDVDEVTASTTVVK
jgi:hypothetical protein